MLNDIPRVARCAPGAELIEQREDNCFVGTLSVRLGPVLLNFKGTVTYREIDETHHRAVAEAAATETKARGTARAEFIFSLSESEEGTRVNVDTDVQLAGSIAQYGRGATFIQNAAQVIMNQFAKNLAQHFSNLEADQAASAKPISGFRVLAKGVAKTIKN